MRKIRIKKDDKVKILAGKDRGKIGKVLRTDKKKSRIFVENINKVKRHQRPSAQNRQGGIVEKEASIDLSNVMLICGKCMAPGRIKIQVLEDGQKMRVCGKCQEPMDA
jgi:large subunit ribosomal protein L24